MGVEQFWKEVLAPKELLPIAKLHEEIIGEIEHEQSERISP